ncbi:MAG: fumarylacetoacetate hydrolase family protein [Propionibacteriaceae bacterium]|nr:fumarylacetoacetate hydrolase family protein [Propionibacteriaceae bacterium]
MNGETVQEDTTADLVFDPVDLVAYTSTIVRLRPGDLPVTGTPGGVGPARRPPRYLAAGDTVSVVIDGVGTLRNEVTDH